MQRTDLPAGMRRADVVSWDQQCVGFVFMADVLADVFVGVLEGCAQIHSFEVVEFGAHGVEILWSRV